MRLAHSNGILSTPPSSKNRDNRAMETATRPTTYRERLYPGLGLFIALFLLVPAVALVTIAFNTVIAIPIGLVVYAIVMTVLTASSPVITVENGILTAGRARIPVSEIGEVELLGSDTLRYAIGPGGDARAHLVIRGWIHTGVRAEITDTADPAPYWIMTSRRPEALADAIRAQQD